MMNEIDKAKLTAPADGFRLWTPKPGQAELLEKSMLTIPLHLSDEMRTPESVRRIIAQMLTTGLCYEYDDFKGIVHIGQIVEGHKAVMSLFFWDASIWTPHTARRLSTFYDSIMSLLNLRRLSAQTADHRIERMAKVVGFQYEGTMEDAFRWEGEFRNLTMLGRIRDEAVAPEEV
jgi:RimJ/RimL family protein N-acetyltransferase